MTMILQIDGGGFFLELKIGKREILALRIPPADISYCLITPELTKNSNWLLLAAYHMRSSCGEVSILNNTRPWM